MSNTRKELETANDPPRGHHQQRADQQRPPPAETVGLRRQPQRDEDVTHQRKAQQPADFEWAESHGA